MRLKLRVLARDFLLESRVLIKYKHPTELSWRWHPLRCLALSYLRESAGGRLLCAKSTLIIGPFDRWLAQPSALLAMNQKASLLEITITSTRYDIEMSYTRTYIAVLIIGASLFVLATDPGMVSTKLNAVSRLIAHASHTVAPPSLSQPSQNLVSWQSAFLGLVPLALNAMTQPSGLDKPFSQSSLLFPSRSSPFVCLADALEVLVLVLIHISHGKTLRHAALEVNWQRARSRLGQDVTELEDSPAEKHPIPFGILFIATLLQAIKLFGMQGLPWTTLWAGLYLFSYVVLAMVGFLAPKDWRDSPPEMVIETPTGRPTWWKLENLSKALLYGSLGVHFICCCWVLDRVIGFVPDGEPASRAMSAAAVGPYVVYTILIGLIIAAVTFTPWIFYQGFL